MPVTRNFLIILLWNANGLNNHKQELDVAITRQTDTVIISVTHFSGRYYFNLNTVLLCKQCQTLFRSAIPRRAAQYNLAFSPKYLIIQ
uniref:Putative secreted protein n=1 Tax=Panstrongylus lignarius TaxID=156445 RepID=A0A224XZ35_9HEMI